VLISNKSKIQRTCTLPTCRSTSRRMM